MSLFHPPSQFPPQLAFLWTIIWVQVQMLRAQIRAAYGRLAAACDGRMAAPEHLRALSLSLGRGVGVRGKGVFANSASADRASPPHPQPLPET
ncbi:MAG: hypothetical protein KDA56_10350 [Hyphomonas sp.]|nr:hypothetical protein [Hyphomonas sp.]